MKQVIFQTGMRVIKQVLDWFQSGGQDNDRTRRQDYSDEGIFADLIYTVLTGTVTFANGSSTVTGSGTAFLSELKPGDTITDGNGIITGVVNAISTNSSLTLTSSWSGLGSSTANARRIDEQFEIVIGDNDASPASPSINVRVGVGYDSTGERLVITSPISLFNPSNPTATSPDGIGGTVVTPLSTGSMNIPLTANTLNYVWIDYLSITDTSVFTIQKATSKKQFYKADNGFQISTTTVSTPPSSASILLGTVDLTGGGVVSPSTISLSGRELAGIKQERVKVKTAKSDRSNATATYSPDTEILIDAHVKAVGTGTVTATNPHGMTPTDIGLNTAEILETHQKFMHTSGIIGDTSSLVSSLYLQPTFVSPGEDYVTIEPLTSSEIALIDGITVTSADVPNPVTLLFSSSVDATATYWVYLDKTTKTIQRTAVDPTSDATKLTIWSFLWTADPFGVPMNGNITNITDLRVFGTMDNSKLNHEDTYTFKRLELEDGTVSLPALTWQSSTGTGLYRIGSNAFGVTNNGTLTVEFDATNHALFADGTEPLPGISFYNDTDTGISRSAANTMRFDTGGTARMVLTSSAATITLPTQISGGPLTIDNGTASVPTLSFSTDTDTGLFLQGSNVLSITTGGTESARFIATGIQAADGTTSLPAHSFISDQNTGMYSAGADDLGFTVGGIQRLHIDTSAVNASLHMRVTDGSVSSPSYSFSSFANTGMYLNTSGSGEIRFSIQSQDYFKVTGSSAQTTIIPFQSGTDGSAGSPAFSFTGDTNTGIYRIGSDNIAISTAGTRAFDIDSNQKWFYRSNLALIPVQVVQNTLLGQFTTSSSSFVNTGLSVAITPKFISSKILVIASGNSTMENGDTHYITLFADSSNLAPTNDGMFHSRQVNNYHCAFQWYDSPSTTSSVTYSVRIRTNGATGFCKWGPDPGSSNGISTITVIEYAQ